jgi:hypothetical protein
LLRFESVPLVDVPKSRKSKHEQIISQLLSDIALMDKGKALKLSLSELPDTKASIRSALNRAARQQELSLATSSDDEFLYVWKADDRSNLSRDRVDC